MGRFALILAMVAFVAAILPGGIYIGMGAGGFAATSGMLAYKKREQHGWTRLTGALAFTVGFFALCIAVGRYGLTFWAVSRLTEMMS